MRIISKFHDYYDTLMRQAMDRSITFVREKKEIHYEEKECDALIKNLPYGLRKEYKEWETSKFRYHCSLFLLGFCGEIIPGVKLEISKKDYGGDPVENIFVWPSFRPPKAIKAFKECKNSVGEKKPKLDFNEAIDKWLKNCEISEVGFFAFFGDNQRTDIFINEIRSWFLKYNTPIFIVNYPDDHIVFNPCLKEIRFFSVVEPTQAFQRIQMYLTNELAGQRDGTVKPVPEKDRLIGHGFDPKWSFRKESKKEK